MDMSNEVYKAIRRVGARRVAEALGVSREAALSLAVGVAAAGTVALAIPNLSRLERLISG